MEEMDSMRRNVSVVHDVDGHPIVIINDVIFKSRRAIEWKSVRNYLKQYIGDAISMASSSDVVYIGADLPKEFTGSKYTMSLKGTAAKAEANASQGIPELIETASNKSFQENREKKHRGDSKNRWYRCDSRFAIPVYDEKGELERYNIFHLK